MVIGSVCVRYGSFGRGHTVTEVAWANLDSSYSDTPSAVTVGVFDGLHSGHRALIDRVVDSDWMPVVVTFQRHPTEVLLHDDIPGFIMSLRQRRQALRELGVEVGVMIDFTETFRTMRGREFLTALQTHFRLRRLVVGHDFRCGYRLDTDTQAIREFFAGSEVEVVEVDPVATGSAPVSSTRIRRAILEGRLDDASHQLGRPYVLDVVDEGIAPQDERACIAMDERRLLPGSRQLVPPGGRYEAILGDETGSERHTRVEIGSNSLCWPLADGESIRYIILKDRRF